MSNSNTKSFSWPDVDRRPQRVRVELLRPLYFDGKRRERGEIIEVDDDVGYDLRAIGRAQIVDSATPIEAKRSP